MKAPNVSEQEVIKWKQLANRAQGSRAVGGRLFLTDERLLFQPNRVDAATKGLPWSTALAQIASVGIEPRTLNPARSRGILQYLHSGSLRNRLRIDVTGGTPQFFVVNNAERVVETIRHAARLDA